MSQTDYVYKQSLSPAGIFANFVQRIFKKSAPDSVSTPLKTKAALKQLVYRIRCTQPVPAPSLCVGPHKHSTYFSTGSRANTAKLTQYQHSRYPRTVESCSAAIRSARTHTSPIHIIMAAVRAPDSANWRTRPTTRLSPVLHT